MPRMGPVAGLALLLSLVSGMQGIAAPSSSGGSSDQKAIYAVYVARAAALKNHNGPAYTATFAATVTATTVAGERVTQAPSKLVANWNKQKNIDILSNQINIVGFSSDGKKAKLKLLWHSAIRSLGVGGTPYFLYQDFESEDQWEKVGGKWIEYSSHYLVNRETTSLKPIPLSDRQFTQQ